jgi:hypothetical protein
MKNRHTGTDCAHMGDARKKASKQGICFKCQHPLHIYTLPGYRPLEALGLLLDDRKGLKGMLLPDPWPRFTVEGAR